MIYDTWKAIFCGIDFSVFGLAEIAEERWGLNPSLQLLAREWGRWDAGASLFRSSGVIHLHISSTPHMIVSFWVKIRSLQYIWCLLINSVYYIMKTNYLDLKKTAGTGLTSTRLDDKTRSSIREISLQLTGNVWLSWRQDGWDELSGVRFGSENTLDWWHTAVLQSDVVKSE